MDIEVHLIRGGTTRNGHWGPLNMRWDRQIRTLRSNFRLWDSNLRALRSKIWNRELQKSVLRSKSWLLRGLPRPKWLSKIFWNIPRAFRLDLHSFSFCFERKLMKIDENQERSDFNTKSPLGALLMLLLALCSVLPRRRRRRTLSPRKEFLQFNYGDWGPVICSLNRQLWTLRSNNMRLEQPEMDIEVHLICGQTARNGHWGPFNTRWDHQKWTLRST